VLVFVWMLFLVEKYMVLMLNNDQNVEKCIYVLITQIQIVYWGLQTPGISVTITK